MKLVFYYKFRFYSSKMNEICLHCHWLYFSSITLSFGQCALTQGRPQAHPGRSMRQHNGWKKFGKLRAIFRTFGAFCKSQITLSSAFHLEGKGLIINYVRENISFKCLIKNFSLILHHSKHG